ncbi:hypothetical protein VSU01S_37690 [Vibrio superstes NBRC 103154]|uniref:Uncharacterized protein n=1 Tax=Vibrio superstes NBRC 103154 TaxID=1219062 RepID=A0A511QVW7_9VIBR|nr:hypothetical protein VSU01S_37690 [Vibrio superstes NBRC 103154]
MSKIAALKVIVLSQRSGNEILLKLSHIANHQTAHPLDNEFTYWDK